MWDLRCITTLDPEHFPNLRLTDGTSTDTSTLRQLFEAGIRVVMQVRSYRSTDAGLENTHFAGGLIVLGVQLLSQKGQAIVVVRQKMVVST